jgi:protocatechuate 3,4-dioxygenase beta subunit
VKAQARCSEANSIESSWSSEFTVDIRPTISGTVTDGGGNPISGVEIISVNAAWMDYTDANGNYRVVVPYNTYVTGLDALKIGYTFSPITQMIEMFVTDNIVGKDFTGTLNTYTLTVVRDGTGSGEVISSPLGINCGVDCTEVYDYNTAVTLTATPESGSEFSGWSGECSGTGTCQVTMTKNTTVTATFNILHTISVPNAPTGTTSGIPNTAYWYSLSNYSICSHGHIVEHQFDWGDSSQSGWISGSNASHSWSSPGIYQVKVRGKCSEGLISGWSSPLSVTINPRISGQVFEMVFVGYGEMGVMLFDKVGKSGVTIYFSGGEGTTTTDTNGYYAKAVTYNWTGTAVPSDAYNYFPNLSQLPYYRTYTDVTADTASQDYEAWPRHIYFETQPSSASAGTLIYVKVKVVDDDGIPLPGVSVNWNIGANPGGVTFPAQSSVTNQNGYADTWISIGTAGVGYTVVADFGTTPSTSVSSVPFDIY